MVSASDFTVLTSWTISDDEGNVTGYIIYYHLSDGNTSAINITVTHNSHTFNEASLRVYRVSVQALSVHLPSTIAGPVTARGQWLYSV